MCLSRDCGLVSLGHPLGTGVVRKAPARDVLMVLGVAVAWTPLAVLVSSTIFINIMVPPLVSGDDLDPWKVRDAREGVMPQPLLTQTQKAKAATGQIWTSLDSDFSLNLVRFGSISHR